VSALSQLIQIDRLVDEQKIGWFNVNLLIWSFLAMFADGYDIGALSFAAPELRRLWHVTPGALGWASTASTWGVLLGAPLLGFVGDRYGRKIAIIVGTLVYGVSTLAVAWTADLEQLVALRFITGIGLGGLMPNTIALNSELSPRRLRATLVTLMFAGITLGSGAPGFVARWLVPQHGWTILFLVGGIVPLCVAACMMFTLPESVKYLALQPSRQAELLATARRLRPELAIADDTQFALPQPATPRAAAIAQLFSGGLLRITPLLWVCFATALMSNYFLNFFLPLIFRQSMAPGDADVAATLYHIGGTVGGIMMSVLLDRFGFVVIALLFAVAAPAIAALGMVPGTFGALAPLSTLAGLAVLGAQFGNNAAAGLLYPTAVRSKGVGWALAIGRSGAIIGPIIGGTLIGMKLPLRQVFLCAAAPMLIGAVAATVLVRLCYASLGGLKLDEIREQTADSGLPDEAALAARARAP
jgi:AAHS family 4-hydroxybenzoate transporter-like MFS transporter